MLSHSDTVQRYTKHTHMHMYVYRYTYKYIYIYVYVFDSMCVHIYLTCAYVQIHTYIDA